MAKETSFVKFKQELKEYKKRFKKAIEELNVISSYLTKGLKNPDFILLNSRLKVLLRNLFKSYGIDLSKYDKDIITNIPIAQEKIKEEIETYYERIKEVEELISIYNNSNIFVYYPDFINLLNYCVSFYKNKLLSIEDISAVFGSYFAFHSPLIRYDRDVPLKLLYIFNGLAKFYNLDGSFKYSERPTNFLLYLKMFIELDSYITEMAVENEDCKIFYEFIHEIWECYQRFLNNYKVKTEPHISKSQEKGYSGNPIWELKKYYSNGRIIQIPADMDQFMNILKDNSLSDTEIGNILHLLEEAKKTSPDYYPFLNEIEKEIVKEASAYLNSLPTNEQNSDTIKSLFEDLFQLKELSENAITAEDEEYIKEEKKKIVEQMQLILNNAPRKTTNNLIFLTDSHNCSYLDQDINLIDKKTKKQAIDLLGAIKVTNSKNFRSVRASKLAFSIMEISNGKIHILFTEVAPDIYLILGLTLDKQRFNKILNRLVDNKEFFESIMETMQDPEKKDQLLYDHELRIPSLDKGIKLARQKPNMS